MSGSTNENIATFFEDPKVRLDPSRDCGILKLLLCNTYACFGKDTSSEEDADLSMPFQPLWAGTMCILAGLDLLGKFAAGSDALGGVGSRFRNYIQTYMPGAMGEEETLWQLRNALLHSFGWYSDDHRGNVYNFRLSRTGPLVQRRPGNIYLINIIRLLQEFAGSIELYKTDLANGSHSNTLKANFALMYRHYGCIDIKAEIITDIRAVEASACDIGFDLSYPCTSPDSSGSPY
jgi:hypothetical protein